MFSEGLIWTKLRVEIVLQMGLQQLQSIRYKKRKEHFIMTTNKIPKKYTTFGV